MLQNEEFRMILSICYYINTSSWFKDQFEQSRCLRNQARFFIKEQYNANQTILNLTSLERTLRTQDPNLNYYRKLCKSKLAQMIVIRLYQDFSGFFRAIKDFKEQAFRCLA